MATAVATRISKRPRSSTTAMARRPNSRTALRCSIGAPPGSIVKSLTYPATCKPLSGLEGGIVEHVVRHFHVRVTLREIVGVAPALVAHADLLHDADGGEVGHIRHRHHPGQAHDLEGMVLEGFGHLGGEAAVPVILPYPPGELKDPGLVQRLYAGHAHDRAALLQHHRAHTGAVLLEITALTLEQGIDARLVPDPAEADVTHHLRVMDEAR